MKKTAVLLLIIVMGVQLTTIAAEKILLGRATEFQGVVGLNKDTALSAGTVLTYQDRTYISLRDMADVFRYNVTWDEENRVASAKRKRYTKPMVENPETAIVIAENVAKWRYADKITERTDYILHTVEEPDGITTTYWIYIFFDRQDFDMEKVEKQQEYAKHHADVSIAVDSLLGFVGVTQTQGDSV